MALRLLQMEFIPSPRADAVARRLRLDAATQEIVGALDLARIPSLLLKGRSFALWLYSDPSVRDYRDVDLLIRESDFSVAGDLLERLGFEQTSWPESTGRPWVDIAWERGTDGVRLELHRTFKGIEAPPSIAWEVLWSHRRRIPVGHTTVASLDEAAMIVLLCLHAAMHASDSKQPLEELNLAIRKTQSHVWIHAVEVAKALGATDGFDLGLRAMGAGKDIIERLGVSPARSLSQRLRTEGASNSAQYLALVGETKGLRPRLRLVVRQLFLPPRVMRGRYQIAQRGTFGLILAYLGRALRHAAQVPSGLVQLWRTTRGIRVGPTDPTSEIEGS